MERVLLVSGSENSRKMLAELVNQAIPAQVSVCKSGSEARRLCLTQAFELVLINAPLSDEFGQELARFIMEKSSAGVILLTKADLCEGVSAQLADYGVLVLPKPLQRGLFTQTLRVAQALQRRLVGLKSENLKLHQKIEDIRLVDRAKLLLMERLKMTEAKAHAFIEKQAMDMRVTKREIAEGIIKTYEY